ncbi:LysR family transcriptional regulator [Celeribacter baekdonensis]|jgi:DNA-binding transcriptional LysR family regulator|uniref:LysR family transcriptional regulator n=1 Tax=Celeribacter baekdonensis TaxID=875171 RepID=A0A2R4M0M3_9RHOB|nr:LysR family transcriptional regulator [Celeribacter baekdonensis]AVW90723.1 LysR family transcriptional regulator [Celeribacter baekdonensis]|tara:strand:+ start:111194 stop:112060 length:867 start_codon:yes stop_codon:yes gene_type:complete
MNLREIELFGTLMRVGTTTETARVLGVSQPAVSGQIKRLESRLGLMLFQRVGNRLEPTSEAQALFAEVTGIFATQARVNERIRSLRHDDISQVRLSATPAIVEGFLGPKLAQAGFEGWPRGLRLWVTDPEEDVRTGRSDFGLQMAFPTKADFQAETLMEVPLWAVMRARHRLSAAPELTLDHLADDALVAYDPSWSPMGDAIRSAFQHHGLSYRPSCEVPFCSTVCEMVASCGGIGVIDRLTADRLTTPDLICRPVRHMPNVPLILFFRRGHPLRGAAQDLISVLRQK